MNDTKSLPPLVTCPNCHGRPLPGPPCAVCEGFGKTTPERAETVKENARLSRA